LAYTIAFAPSAERDFRKLPRAVQLRLSPHIDGFARNPRPPGATKLKGAENAWRIRVGDFRILYEIHDRILLVLLVRVAHRREVYR